jgi:hypothetical protein
MMVYKAPRTLRDLLRVISNLNVDMKHEIKSINNTFSVIKFAIYCFNAILDVGLGVLA